MSGGTLDDDDSVEPVAMEICDAWKPLGDLLVGLRRGAKASFHVPRAPAVPKDESGGDKIGLMRLHQKHVAGELDGCEIRVEIDNVEMEGLDGPPPTLQDLVAARFRAEQRRVVGDSVQAELRYRHAVKLAERVENGADPKVAAEIANARAALGWMLAVRAASEMNADTISSKELAAAQKVLEEAKLFLDLCPDNADVLVGKAQIALAEDDLDGAESFYEKAKASKDANVCDKLNDFGTVLRKEKGLAERVRQEKRIKDLVPSLKSEDPKTVLGAIEEMRTLQVRWEIVMETRAGVVLGELAKNGSPEISASAKEFIEVLTQESKTQRPLWE
jgi:tetratricopeptide (TPR) repeat protein